MKNKIYDFFIFNKSGICIVEKQLEILFPVPEQYNNYKLYIKNIAHSLLINFELKKSNSQENEKLNINKINTYDNEFKFKSIQTDKIKILFLIKNSLIFVGIFPKISSIQYQRLLLFHIFIALNNFKGDFISCTKLLNENEEYNSNNFIALKELYNKKKNVTSKETNDILEILIFQYYFLKAIILHFSKVFNDMFRKEDLNLKQTKFRNLYILDVSNLSVILDMCKIQGENNYKKNKKYYKFEVLFDEIIYHSKHMYNEYIKENEIKYTLAGSDFRFVKFECTSTYPRLLFIIKFIPVLKGISIIHVYSQKKLSRNNDNTIQSEQGINCKEVDLLFGSFIKDNPNFEFKYGAPKKLQYIEKFFEEFFITGRNNLGVFRLNNIDKKFKYVNYDVINIINSFQISNSSDIEQIFNDINKKLEEDYLKIQKEKNEKKMKKSEDSESNIDKNDEGNEMKKIDILFTLNKDNYYKEFFNKNEFENIDNVNNNKNMISKDNENENGNKLIGIEITNNDNIDQNLIINKLINADSERKSLIKKENKTLSLYNSKDYSSYKNINTYSKNSKFDDLSLISEVKKDEKFDLKVINKKEINNQNDKEDTKEKISNSSSKEREYKMNELLDLINSNIKIHQQRNENSKIQEEFEENLTKKDINSSKLSKNSITRKNKSKLTLEDKEQVQQNSRNFLINH